MHRSLMISMLAQGDPAAPSGLMGLMAPMLLIAVVWYFLILRPQGRERRDREKLLNALKKNDRVVTNAGIHGLIANVKETTVMLKVADNVKIEVEKSAINSIVKTES